MTRPRAHGAPSTVGRLEAMCGLWSAAPDLRQTAHRQGGKLRAALAEHVCPCGGCGGDPHGKAWRVGHHGGRVLALRLTAYDRRGEA